MRSSNAIATLASIALLPAGIALAQTPPAPMSSADTKHVRVTIENLTTGQAFSPSVFMSHNASAPPLFKEGEKASFGLMRIAEEGNPGPLLSENFAKHEGGMFGHAAVGISILPGKSRSVEIEVDKDHPMISGAWMLVMTNDGFTGINAVNAYEMSAAKTMDLSAMEAGTEKNNEKKAYLVAMMGTERDPEGGVVQKHSGIRGDADAPAEWKFDPAKPVARITITPVTMKATQ